MKKINDAEREELEIQSDLIKDVPSGISQLFSHKLFNKEPKITGSAIEYSDTIIKHYPDFDSNTGIAHEVNTVTGWTMYYDSNPTPIDLSLNRVLTKKFFCLAEHKHRYGLNYM